MNTFSGTAPEFFNFGTVRVMQRGSKQVKQVQQVSVPKKLMDEMFPPRKPEPVKDAP